MVKKRTNSELPINKINITIPKKVIQKWQIIVNIMAETINVPAALIMKIDPPYIEVFRSSESNVNPYKVGSKEHLAGLYCERVITTKDKLLVANALKDRDWDKNPDIKLGMISYLGFPILLPDGEVFGTICVLDTKENDYCKSYEKLMLQFKELVETHLSLLFQSHKLEETISKRKQAEEELKKHRDHLEELVEERTAELKKINEQLQREIAERKRTDNILKVSHHFLEIAYRHMEMTPLLKEFMTEVRNLTDCTSVGIRILDEVGNIPYHAYEGFSQQFYELESPLSIKSDQCMCINVIKGTADPKLPFYTEGGSFHMNGTKRFLATISEEEKGPTRNMCNEFGYESVALVPIRFGDFIIGLIHVADPRQNMVPLDTVELLEETAKQLGTAIQKVRAEEELRSSREQLRNLSTYLQSVREEERTRIAQMIHDECGQELTALKIDLSWLGNKLRKDQKSLLEKIKSMERHIDVTIQKTQRMSAELRPGVLDDLGLVAAIEWQAKEFQNRTGIKFEVALDPKDIILGQECSTTIFRILQETLTNVVRHAEATSVKATLKEKAGQLELKVRDNGKGITEEQISDPKSFGLIGIRERAYFWGGKVKIRGIKDKGTTVTVSIPLHKKGETDDKNTHR